MICYHHIIRFCQKTKQQGIGRFRIPCFSGPDAASPSSLPALEPPSFLLSSDQPGNLLLHYFLLYWNDEPTDVWYIIFEMTTASTAPTKTCSALSGIPISAETQLP